MSAFQRPAQRCDNCLRAASPPPQRVALLVEGEIVADRCLCSACRVHVTDAMLEYAPWIGAPPTKATA